MKKITVLNRSSTSAAFSRFIFIRLRQELQLPAPSPMQVKLPINCLDEPLSVPWLCLQAAQSEPMKSLPTAEIRDVFNKNEPVVQLLGSCSAHQFFKHAFPFVMFSLPAEATYCTRPLETANRRETRATEFPCATAVLDITHKND